MSPDQGVKLARRVVTGVNSRGQSTIVDDGETPVWVRRPTGSVIMDIWRAETLPVDPLAELEERADPLLAPPSVGLCVRMATFPPSGGVDPAGSDAYEESLREIYGDQGDSGSKAMPGMHRTQTVDVVTVVDGEIWVVMEDGETLLRAGDSLVQRGTTHAWQNRADRPCTLISTMLAAIGSNPPAT